MTSGYAPSLFRSLALVGVLGALVDPGCATTRRPTIDIEFAEGVPAPVRERVQARIEAATRNWASVDVDAPGVIPRRASADMTTDVRVVVGDAAPVLTSLRAVPAALAVRIADPVLEVTRVSVPTRVAVGVRVGVQVSLAGVPAGTGRLTLRLSDPTSDQELAEATVDTATTDGTWQGEVPWLPTRVGEHVLRLTAMHSGPMAVRPAFPADAIVDVLPPQVRVEFLDARPTWTARFARLALGAQDGIVVSSETRIAPGVTVRTTGPADEGREAPLQASVLLVGGVEALTAHDVSRLVRDVRDRGRALVLLLDEPPRPGPWQRLWSGAVGGPRSSPQPLLAHVGTHAWMAREWLAVLASTDVVPLAYFDSVRDPIVVGRGLGAGGVLLVTGLDTWRWRAHERADFVRGWQTLVRGLAAGVPAPLSLTAWASGDGTQRSVHADVVVRPDLRAAGVDDVRAEIEWSGTTHALPLVALGDGRFRGAVRQWKGERASVKVHALQAGEVVARAQGVIHVSAIAPTATWDAVERRQRERGHAAATEATLGPALETLHGTVVSPRRDRWFATRTVPYAMLTTVLLGSDWILRRVRRRR